MKTKDFEIDLNNTAKKGEINFLCISGSQFIQRLKQRRLLTTFSKALDISLDGGLLSSSGVYGICGAPGAGKTQFCLQLAVNVQLPSFLWGCEKKAWYIDTQGGFTVTRCQHIAKCAAHHFNSMIKRDWNLSKNGFQKQVDSQMFLNGILVTRLFDDQELLDLLMNMDSILTDSSSLDFFQQLGLIIIDSISFPFRSSFSQTNPYAISSVMKDIGRVLNHISLCYDLVILITNQVTTRQDKKKFTANKEKPMYQDASIQPCFGRSWEKMCTTTLFINLTEAQSKRQIHVYRQHNLKTERCCSVEIQLLPEGIRDVEEIVKTT
ncbi:DNA repair protein RAD51 homolog 3-like [Hylaeus volcanicus]|uniref:DNA repair protein RAD51 homolog 3-like n=1 Tax=Hylaeus volcanicus TaxID=313075 RepID=UPI0023B7C623|nr:DNA repair protein RAD51 homolog 3-like [Hylaeus volcanicus]XP_053990794.1 DNA repair protein RAD51 homolog 3-like [Hylaeus volcanicus]